MVDTDKEALQIITTGREEYPNVIISKLIFKINFNIIIIN